VLARLLARRTPGIVDGGVWQSWLRAAIATAAMTLAVVGVLALFPEAERWSEYTLRLGAGVATGALVYFALARLLGMAEIADVLRRTPPKS
jgi:peptidoglycan biosynthesis protein MviN/MurJ (putative lipid II flippase)